MKKTIATALLAAAIASVPAVFADDQQDQDRRKAGAYLPSDPGTGVAAGSANSAASAASGSLTTKIAVGVGTAAVIGAIVAASSSNNGSSSTSTTSTSH